MTKALKKEGKILASIFIVVWSLFLISSCGDKISEDKKGKEVKLVSFDYPEPVNTESKEVAEQVKKTFSFDKNSVFFDNQFDAARLNDVLPIGENIFRVIIRPENAPINSSPWYAFRIWSKNKRKIKVSLTYDGLGQEKVKHRYFPKLSKDGKKWNVLDSNYFAVSTYVATMTLEVSPDTLWVSAQPIINSKDISQWVQKLKKDVAIQNVKSIGKSKLGRDIMAFEIVEGKLEKKEMIIVFSRQHPPETTGFLAMKHFVHRILEKDSLATQFKKRFALLVFPLLNPDGVDLGHWRHNAGGVDLNRDWQYYHQPEVRQVAEHSVRRVEESQSKVVLGLDFHSTWNDVYYTNHTDSLTALPNFSTDWIANIHRRLGEKNKKNNKPSNITKPISKSWFYLQFGTVGITYEIGDDTPVEFIRKKG